MEPLTGRKRISAAFKRTFTDQEVQLDRIPAYPIAGQVNAQLVGASIREFLLEPRTFIKAQVASYERFRPDIIVMQGDLLMEAEAMGNVLRFPEDSMCVSTKVALEDKGKLTSLKPPDPYKDGRFPAYLEIISETRKIIADSIVSAVLAGPWTIAIGLRGATDLIKDTIKDPDYVHELMEFCTPIAINAGEAVVPLKAGLSYSEAPASCSLISPKLYRTFIRPHHQRIVDHFKAKKVGVGFHICGFIDPILEDVVNLGITNLSIDAPTSLSKAVEVTRGRAVLIGNVNTNLFFSGTRDQMAQAMQNCMDIASKGTGYILASGCEVPGVAEPESMEWFMALAQELGGSN